MEYREFGRTGEKVSIIGMGTYYDVSWIILSRLGIMRNRALHIEAIKAGIEIGINLIDTAELYNTEGLIKEAIRGYKRDELFIATKVWPNHLKYDSLIRACERSLRRLGVNYVDLYQIHFPSKRVPIGESIRAMEKLVEMGKIKYIGVSNFSLNQMIEAEEAMKKNYLASTQMPYSLVDRRIEEGIIPYCRNKKIAILCYYPLGHGKIVKEMPVEVLKRIEEKHGKRTRAQIALNYIISKHEITFPIPRASRPDHVRENEGATGWRLDEEDIKFLEETTSKI